MYLATFNYGLSFMRSLLLFSLLCVPLVFFANPRASLEKRLIHLNSYRAKFKAVRMEQKGRVLLPLSSGHVYLKRPLTLTWETTRPYRQVISLNKGLMRIHDIDLDETTTRHFSMQNLMRTPAVLLLGKRAELNKAIKKVDLKRMGNLYMYKLIIRKNNGLNDISIYFHKNNLVKMLVTNALGQRIIYTFSNIKQVDT